MKSCKKNILDSQKYIFPRIYYFRDDNAYTNLDPGDELLAALPLAGPAERAEDGLEVGHGGLAADQLKYYLYYLVTAIRGIHQYSDEYTMLHLNLHYHTFRI